MNSSSAPQTTQTNKSMSIMLFVASILVVSVGISLYLMPEQTERFFAWTINPPLTAAFLGAGYWASFILEFLSSRERSWARARIAVPAVLVFTFLTLIVTLMHLDRFHFDSPQFITVSGTWVWLGVYAGVPIVMAWLLFKQLQVPQIDPERVAPLPTFIRVILGLQGIFMLLLGVLMLVTPNLIIPIWPWTLSILTSQAIGAWGVGMGIAAVHTVWENDWWRSSIAMASLGLYGLLQIINLIRYYTTLQWQEPSAIIYTLFMISIFVLGAYGYWKARRFSA